MLEHSHLKPHLPPPEKYELAELDRKKPKVVRRGFTGSFIRYQSTTMPLIQELDAPPCQPCLEEPDTEMDVEQVCVCLHMPVIQNMYI